MRRLRRTLILSVLGVVALFIGYELLGPFALRHYVSKLRAQGEKVRLEELHASLSTKVPDTVGALTNLAGRLGSPPVHGIALMQVSGLGEAVTAWNQPAPAAEHPDQTSTNLSWTELKKQVEKNSAILAELRRILESPAANEGPRSDLWEVRLHPPPARASLNWLECAALCDLHDGQQTEALQNLKAITRLADVNREEPNLMSQLMRAAVADCGVRLTWEMLQAGHWSDEQLRTMQGDWEKLSLLDGFEWAMEGERSFGFEAEDRYAATHRSPNANAAATAGAWVYRHTLLAHDLRFRLQYNQTLVELVRAFRANEPYDHVVTSWKKLESSLEWKYHGPQKFLYLLSLISIPNTSRAFDIVAKAETERRLAIAAIAIERYKAKFGQPPATLDLLVPGFIGAVPRDCMSERPLCYHLNPNGGFTLYSTGKDGVDNGGDPTPLLAGANDALWDRRDTVWPTAARATVTAITDKLQANAAPSQLHRNK